MNQNQVKELTEGMQRLCAIANRIVATPGEVSAIERDLLLDDLRGLYDLALRLSVVDDTAPTVRTQANGDSPSAEGTKAWVAADEADKMPDEEILNSTVMATMAAMSMPDDTEREKPKEEIHEQQLADQNTPVEITTEASEKEEPIEEEPSEEASAQALPLLEEMEAETGGLLFDEVIIEPEPTPEPEVEFVTEPEPMPEPEPEQEEKHKDPEPHHTGSQVSLLDYLKHPVDEQPTVRTLGESLTKKVSDLRTVININEKFSFMSDLFKNNMKAYNDFILRLNTIDTRDEALLYVSETSAQWGWNESSPTVQAFYKVFDKKFER